MPVVAAGGLVGRVLEVGPQISTVLPLTDRASAVGVRCVAAAPAASEDSAGCTGVVQGSPGARLRLDLLDPTARPQSGDLMVTSGLRHSRFPAGVAGRPGRQGRQPGQCCAVRPAGPARSRQGGPLGATGVTTPAVLRRWNGRPSGRVEVRALIPARAFRLQRCSPLGAVLLSAIVLHAGVLPHLSLGGVAPDVLLMASWPWRWRRGHGPAPVSASPPASAPTSAPLTNRALQGLYAPGSTFKPVTAHRGLPAHRRRSTLAPAAPSSPVSSGRSAPRRGRPPPRLPASRSTGSRSWARPGRPR